MRSTLALPLVLSLVAGGASADLSYADFGSTAGLTLVQDATTVGAKLVITPNALSQKGAVWADTRQNVGAGFSTTFEFRASPSSGADGFTFCIQNDALGVIGFHASALGYGSGGSSTEIQNCVVVEFDTYASGSWGDPSGNHVAVHSKLTTQPLHDNSNALGTSSSIPTLNDGAVHTAQITYTPGTMSVYVDDLTNPALVVSIDLRTLPGFGDDKAWVGFTGSTGGLSEVHEVLSWTFADGGSLTGTPDSISLSTGGAQLLSLDAGVGLAGATYFMGGTVSGTTPGVPYAGLTIPLNPDAYFLFTLNNPGAAPLVGGVGTLNSLGQASAQFTLAPGSDPSLAGLSVHHAALLLDAGTFTVIDVTPAVSCDLAP